MKPRGNGTLYGQERRERETLPRQAPLYGLQAEGGTVLSASGEDRKEGKCVHGRFSSQTAVLLVLMVGKVPVILFPFDLL